jgi:hypothetical protein
MRITRIDIEGRAGHVAIERQRGSDTIRIDSILRNPKKEQAWKTWELPVGVGEEELFQIAEEVQRRCEGVRGTNGDIQDYFNELHRFAD